LPLLVALALLQKSDDLNQVLMAFMLIGLFLMLANQAAAKPLALIKIAAALDLIAVEKGLVRLFDQQLIANHLPIDQETNKIGLFRGSSSTPVHFIGQRLRQHKAIDEFKDKVDRRHPIQSMVLVEADLIAGAPR